jgi:hypothetical protein
MSAKEGTETEVVHPNVRPYFLASSHTSTEELVALYSVYQTAMSYYTNIIWIFPGAFLAMNVTAWNQLQHPGDRWLLLVVAVADLLFTQVFLKLAANERGIIKVIHTVEATLRMRRGTSVVPSFRSEYNWFTRISSARVFSLGIATMTGVVIAGTIWKLFH